MKNLLIYYNPKGFLPEYWDLTKIQIDNSLDLGWKVEDIVLVMNFPFEYRGVKSVVIDGDFEVEFDRNKSSKIAVINRMFDDGLIEDDVYWFHDVDAFQIVPFDLKLKKDAAFTDHGAFSKGWNAGSFFFKKEARDIFKRIGEEMEKPGATNEQTAFTEMWKRNDHDVNSRYELLDTSYNIGIYRIPQNVERAKGPIKVLHFHPHKKHHYERYIDLLPEKLIKIFNKHGISW